MKLKTDEPYIPQDVLLKIEELKSILDEANELYEEIIEWYDSELKSYDERANATDELYSPGTGTIVEYISPECILEGLNILQTANEVNS